MSELRRWLTDLGLADHADAFEDEQVDAAVLGELTDDDLAQLGLPLGARRLILREIRDGRGPPGSIPPPLGGQRRHVTVLFADVSGFTAMSERLGPEAVHSVMGGCFAVLGEVVQRYEGTVTQYAGDGVMALFGAPIAQEDHAARAAHAALDIQEGVAGYAAGIERELGVGFRMRVGIHSGIVVVGGVGGDDAGRYTALGDTVNVAARLQQMAAPGEVVATEETRRLAGETFAWTAVGAREIRGRADPAHVHRLTGRGTAERRSHRRSRVRLGPMVGREDELRVLSEAWACVEGGAGRVVSVVGEAGVGKSRLLLEFTDGLPPAARCVEGTCFTFGEATSFLPFLRIVRELCGIRDGASETTAKDAIASRLAALGIADDRATYLHHLMSYDVEDEVFPYLTPELVRRRTLETLRLLLLAEADAAPLVVIIEDVHWIDRATEEVLGALAEELHDRRILLALAYRPEYLNQWRTLRHHAEVRLRPLSHRSGAEMVRSILAKPYAADLRLSPLTAEESLAVARRILGPDSIAPELERLVVDRTEGNPLFVEELTQALVERGDVARQEGELTLSRPASELEIPPNLYGVLLARIDRLPADLRETLRLAATIGRVFSAQVLAAAAGDGRAVDDHLDRLRALDFVHRVAAGPDDEYSFKHVLTQEAVYSTLLAEARARYHEAVGRAIERLHPDRLDENAEVLARHYDRAGLAVEAIRFLVVANRKAVRRNAVSEAYEHLTRALELLRSSPATPDSRRTHVRLLCDNVIVFQLLFRYEECYRRLHEALPVAASVSAELEGMVLNRLGHMEWAFCELDAATGRTVRARRIWAIERNPEELAYTMMLAGYVHLVAGRFDEIPRTERLALEALDSGFNLRWCVWTLSFASMGYSWSGAWDSAFDRGRRALSVAEEYDDTSLVCFAAWVLGLAHGCRGDLGAALELTSRSVHVAPTPSDRSWAGATHAWILARAGALDEAIDALEEAVVANRAARFVWSEVMATYLAEAYLLAGRLDRCRAVLDEVAAYCAEHGMAYFGAEADRLRGEVLRRQAGAEDGDARARLSFERAIASFRSIGARNALASALAGLGALHLERGRRQEGARCLNEARALYTDLGTLRALEGLPTP